MDHLQDSDLSQRMANLDCLILDEADQLMDIGFRPDIGHTLSSDTAQLLDKADAALLGDNPQVSIGNFQHCPTSQLQFCGYDGTG